MTWELGELLTRWTVRVAVACYVARLVVGLSGRCSSRRAMSARVFWTAGCAVYLVHVACAFHFFHEWSHRTAYHYTIARTAEVTGWAWGGGLFINYVFTLLWIADVGVWWRGDAVRPTTWSGRLLHGVFAFLMFNATVVFGPPFWRWVGGAVLLLLGGLIWRRFVCSSSSAFDAEKCGTPASSG